MKGLLKILIIIFFICYFSMSYPQVDPTIPLPQRNLQNNLTNPIINDNPFIEQKVPKSSLPKNTPKGQPLPPNQEKEEIQKNIQEEEKEEEVNDEEKKENTEEKDEKKEEKSNNNSSKNESSNDKDDGLFGSFRIGPMIGFGILMGPNISIESKIFKYFGFSASYGTYNNFDLFQFARLKTILNSQSNDFQFDTLTLSYTQFEGKFSIYPFGGSFFIGAAYGRRNINLNSTGNLNVTVPNYPTRLATPFSESIAISSTYWTPQIGWLATWGGTFGWFAIGTELGVQLTLQSSVTTTTTFTDPSVQSLVPLVLQSPEYTSLTNEMNTSITNALKDYPLPYWNILKIGWIF